jgi:shikimate dehydrogenase
MKKNYTLIGHNLKHTVSPEIHSRLFQLSESNSEYNVTDISEDMLTLKYPELKRLSGYNITIPHKVKIIPLLEKLDESARRYGAVNCVSNIGGISTGFNTDAFGFVKALEAEQLSLSGEILLLGFGSSQLKRFLRKP